MEWRLRRTCIPSALKKLVVGAEKRDTTERRSHLIEQGILIYRANWSSLATVSTFEMSYQNQRTNQANLCILKWSVPTIHLSHRGRYLHT
jgi:hypothetical protein